MKKIFLFLITILVITSITPIVVLADTGRHPTIEVEIWKDEEIISEDAGICYNVLTASGFMSQKSKNYQYIKPLEEDYNKISCSYCNNGNCEDWFYKLPSKLAIVYPAHSFIELVNGPQQNISPVLYKSEEFDLKRFNTYDYKFKAVLNEDGTITLKNKTPTISVSRLISFAIAFIQTIILELLVALLYLTMRKLSKKILWAVTLANIISLAIFWFLFPLIFKNIIPLLIVGELFVFLSESYMIHVFSKKQITLRQSTVMSLLMNVTSFIVGGFMFLIVSLFFGI